jgi:hypothetical protein
MRRTYQCGELLGQPSLLQLPSLPGECQQQAKIWFMQKTYGNLGLSVVGFTLLNASAGFSCSCLLGGLQALVCGSKDLEILTIDSQFAPQCGVLRASRPLHRQRVWSGEHRPHLLQSLPRSEHCGQPWPSWRQSTDVLLVSLAEILEKLVQTYLSLSVVSFALLDLSTGSESGQESIILILFDFLFGQGAASGFGSSRFLGSNLWGNVSFIS